LTHTYISLCKQCMCTVPWAANTAEKLDSWTQTQMLRSVNLPVVPLTSVWKIISKYMYVHSFICRYILAQPLVVAQLHISQNVWLPQKMWKQHNVLLPYMFTNKVFIYVFPIHQKLWSNTYCRVMSMCCNLEKMGTHFREPYLHFIRW
jgi:hypothetical protein